ncbi:F0F1 ATP synthase subunit delta [Thermoanaerobacterium sp. DL9XJH110]|uniref:F0F1 ATP synthase subunit delta n=1 Tax=Thermoanaerobacterium sp. DL9XJH110 TaxID=3386643 RepID=UPI003BB63B27
MAAVAAVYAEALFSVAREMQKIEDFKNQLWLISHLLKSDLSFRFFLTHPGISREDKKNVIREALAQKISQEMLNFIFFIIDKNRQNILQEIFGEYSNLYRKYREERYARVVTAVPLTEEEREQLKAKLDGLFNTHVVIENIVDPQIIGGVMIRMGFQVIDGTIGAQLDRLKAMMV